MSQRDSQFLTLTLQGIRAFPGAMFIAFLTYALIVSPLSDEFSFPLTFGLPLIPFAWWFCAATSLTLSLRGCKYVFSNVIGVLVSLTIIVEIMGSPWHVVMVKAFLLSIIFSWVVVLSDSRHLPHRNYSDAVKFIELNKAITLPYCKAGGFVVIGYLLLLFLFNFVPGFEHRTTFTPVLLLIFTVPLFGAQLAAAGTLKEWSISSLPTETSGPSPMVMSAILLIVCAGFIAYAVGTVFALQGAIAPIWLLLLFATIALFGLLLWVSVLGLSQPVEFLKLFRERFFGLTIPLAPLIVLNTYPQIMTEGIFESTYFLLWIATLFTITSAYWLVLRPVKAKIVFSLFSILVLLGLYGPLSAKEVARKSQSDRLQRLLFTPLLVEGNSSTITKERAKSIYSILIYFMENHHVRVLKDLFALYPEVLSILDRNESMPGTRAARIGDALHLPSPSVYHE
jgi:Domain of unknown function (DUF4153)